MTSSPALELLSTTQAFVIALQVAAQADYSLTSTLSQRRHLSSGSQLLVPRDPWFLDTQSSEPQTACLCCVPVCLHCTLALGRYSAASQTMEDAEEVENDSVVTAPAESLLELLLLQQTAGEAGVRQDSTSSERSSCPNFLSQSRKPIMLVALATCIEV